MSDADLWYKQGNEMMMQEKTEDAVTAYDKATEFDQHTSVLGTIRE